ncbi:hypothetical protein C5U62_31565 [Pseudomonas protegens]|uniref:Uncharacterized protein n=1 Tax=Pseudomonas protegens TaxID=380021 RepID=A0A2T6GBH3_9PSED|nr:hypothetical protein [Pseudomonas protegens]PUA41506.1 hypothetical protein C5U62_31565 [Pseudomonas protegens]
MKSEYEEIDLKTVLEQRFAAGQGVITLSASMTDEQILTLIKSACIWSKGKVFQIIPPHPEPNKQEKRKEHHGFSDRLFVRQHCTR